MCIATHAQVGPQGAPTRSLLMWLIHMCDMTHYSYVWHDSFPRVTHSHACVRWLCVGYVTHSHVYVYRDPPYMCDHTQGASTRSLSPWLIHTSNTTHSYVWDVRHTHLYASTITHTYMTTPRELTLYDHTQGAPTACTITHTYMTTPRELPLEAYQRDSFIRVTWLNHSCDMTHSFVWHDSFIRVTWLIHMCDMTHSYVWDTWSLFYDLLPLTCVPQPSQMFTVTHTRVTTHRELPHAAYQCSQTHPSCTP